MKACEWLERIRTMGDEVNTLVKAFSEAVEIQCNGKVINWPQEELTSEGPIMAYFDDGSFLKLTDVPTSDHHKTTCGVDEKRIRNSMN